MIHNLDLVNKKYSEKELEENLHLFYIYDWFDISAYQELSEEFIKKYQDKVNWYNISFFQNLSEEFIKNHFDKIDFGYLMENQNISNEIKEEIKLLKEII